MQCGQRAIGAEPPTGCMPCGRPRQTRVVLNPFDASTMEGVGRNQPRQFVTGEFRPQTPHILGAVMNGIGGHEDDSPWLRAGSWQTREYWTPMVGYTMWLMAELQKEK